MWPSDDARGDFVLAAGTLILAPHVLTLIAQVLSLFGVQLGAVTAGLLLAILAFAFTGLVPLLLARHRNEGVRAFGLDQPRGGLVTGVFVAVPVVVLTVLLAALGDRPVADALVGVFADLGGAPSDAALTLLTLVSVLAGSVLLYTFLTVKARDGFRRTEVTQLAALRTYGMGAAAAALLLGLILSVGAAYDLVPVVLESAALAAMLLTIDRLVAAGAITSRATVLAPAIVVLFMYVSLSPRNFIATAHGGLLAAGVVLGISVLVETRRYAWATVTVLTALVVYDTALTPKIPFLGI